MGQTLSEPITTKQTSHSANGMFNVGTSCMQGWRISMEDSHTHYLSLPEDPGTAFFAVYDGHGSDKVSDYVSKHLHKFIANRPEYKDDIVLAMKKAFMDIDDQMRGKEHWGVQAAGSTASVVLIKDKRLFCANIGDSRTIACVNGRLEPLSWDHKPNNPEETKRITNAGGFVEFNRVNGNLGLSRAFGDFMFKRNATKSPEEQIVTAFPDVIQREIDGTWEFILLASDGIWDVMTSKMVLEYCRARIALGKHPEKICEELINDCLSTNCQMSNGLGGDNMTVLLICFLHNKTYAELKQRCNVQTFYDSGDSKDIEVGMKSMNKSHFSTSGNSRV